MCLETKIGYKKLTKDITVYKVVDISRNNERPIYFYSQPINKRINYATKHMKYYGYRNMGKGWYHTGFHCFDNLSDCNMYLNLDMYLNRSSYLAIREYIIPKGTRLLVGTENMMGKVVKVLVSPVLINPRVDRNGEA